VLQRPDLASVRVILVTSEGPDPIYKARAEYFSQTSLVMGGPRVLQRLSAALSDVLGVRQRGHRRARCRIGSRVAIASGRNAVDGVLVDISESGCGLLLPVPVDLGERVEMEFTWRDKAQTLSGTVVRRTSDRRGQFEVGLRLLDLS